LASSGEAEGAAADRVSAQVNQHHVAARRLDHRLDYYFIDLSSFGHHVNVQNIE